MKVHKSAQLSVIFLILANLVPMVGVLFFGWDLLLVMLTFWAESAVIGFYWILKLAFTARWAALFFVPFFAIHFGGFMVAHLIVLTGLFTSGNGWPVTEATSSGLLGSILPVSAVFFISHGISFWINFLGKKEYKKYKTGAFPATSGPYSRIVIMHVTLIFGGMAAQFIGTNILVLAMLIILKIIMDVRSHLREHGASLNLGMKYVT